MGTITAASPARPARRHRGSYGWEIGVFVALLVTYKSVRALGGDNPTAAFANAASIIAAEGALGCPFRHRRSEDRRGLRITKSRD